MKKPLHMQTGVNIGDYHFEPDNILDVVKKYKFGKENGGLFNFLAIRLDKERPTAEQLYEWARYFHDNEIYFKISGNVPRRGDNRTPKLTPEETAKIQELAGEYFLGDGIGEFGGFYATKAKGYYARGMSENPVDGLKDCQEAKDTYIRQIGKEISVRRENGSKIISSTEAVTFTQYDYEAGVDHCIIEVAPRNMEQIMAFGRGAQRAYKKESLGAWFAHEFYGGYHQFDPLKAKRFKAEYYSMYLAGIDFCCLESGYRGIYSHVPAPLPEDHPLPKSYLKEAEDFAKFCNEDVRPGKNGPITKVAFVKGNLDGYAFGNSSSLWGQYYDEKWGFNSPEYSYRILDEVYHASEWNDGKNFGDYDYSHAPAYGLYDVIPATCPLDVMKQYEWVIYCGWNTMTHEIYETLKEYVKGGGKLFITGAHLRDSIDRNEKGKILDADWEELLGVKLSEEIYRTNDGYKFRRNSTIDGIKYPGTESFLCDPFLSAGYTEYVKIEPTKAIPVCFIADSFAPDIPTQIPIVTEHKLGLGSVMFMAASEYPGAPAIYPLYKFFVKAILTASHRTSDIKVLGSDKLRFAVYADEEKYKVYILNTDYNFEQRARVIYNGEIIGDKVIDSIGLAIVEFKK